MFEAGLARRVVGALGTACLLSLFAAPGSAAVPRSASELTVVAADGPVVGPEHRVSNPIDGAALGWQTSPSIAFDGTNYLVAWRDGRTHDRTGYDVYGARVTPDGRVLDPVGIPIATGAGDESPPRVAFGGGTFLVVWSTAGAPEIENDVVGTRVTPSGTVLDPSGIPIASTPRNEFGADVAFGAGRFLVVWTDEAAAGQPSDVYGTRVDPSGSVVAPSRLPISTAPGPQSQPTVGFGIDSFLVAWTDGRVDPTLSVYGARVSPSGTVLDPSGIAIATTSWEAAPPAIAFNGTDHLVVWSSYRTSRWGVFGTRVSPSGAVLDPAGIAISRLTDSAPARPTPVALGATILVAWNEDHPGGPADVAGARIDAGGANLDPSGLVIAGSVSDHGSGVGLGSDGSNWFAAWDDARMGPRHLFGAPVRPDGSTLGPGTLIARSANSQGGSSIAFDGTNYLAVWTDNRAGNIGQVFAARLSPAGRRLDGVDLPVSLGAAGGNPAVAFDGARYVVAWVSPGVPEQVHVIHVNPAGHLEGPAVTLPDPPFPQFIDDLEIAVGDTGVLVIWSDFSRFGSGVRAVRLDREGNALDPTPIVVSADGGSASVATDGHDYLVVWKDFTMGAQSLRGTRVTADGTVLDPAGFLIRGGVYAQESAVAWNGQRYLAVWSESPTGEHFGLFGARVTREGTVQDRVPLEISTGPRNERQPAVTANGPFLVAWRETDEAGVHDVRGTRVTDVGTVVDRPALPIAASDRLEGDVALTRGPGAAWGASYTRFVREAPYGSDRVFLRNIAPK